MAVNLSSLGGAGWQFFDNNGNPLAGGLLYTYLAGTTTPATTYTSSSGTTPNANPIVLDSAGRVAEEIWLTEGVSYKFELLTSTSVQIWVKDNISGINDISEFSASNGSSLIGFIQAGANAQIRTVQSKLRDVVSVKDFGAAGDGVTDDSAAIAAAIQYCSTVVGSTYPQNSLYFPAGRYLVTQNNWIGANLMPTGVYAGRFDFTIEGVGRNTSVIVFKPATANGACYDQTATPARLLNGFSVNKLGFVFDNSANGSQPVHFIRSQAAAGAASQNWRLYDCRFTGVVGSRLFWLDSTTNANEDVISVYDTMTDGFENVVYCPLNLEAVIHAFYSLDCLNQRGSVFKYNTGGSLQVDTLQCILTGTPGVDTAVLELTGGTTTKTYRLNNVRAELRGANTRMFLMTVASENTIIFSNSEVANTINNQAWAKVPVQHHAMITFKDCILPVPDYSVTGSLGTKGTLELTDSLSGFDYATVGYATSCITFENCACLGNRQINSPGFWVDFTRLTAASANYRTSQVAYKGCIGFPDCTEYGFLYRMGRSYINRQPAKLAFRGTTFPQGNGVSAPVVDAGDWNVLVPLNNYVMEIVVFRKAQATAATNYQIEFIDTQERNAPGTGVIFGATVAAPNNAAIAQRVSINRLFTGTIAERTIWCRMAAGFTLGSSVGAADSGGVYAEVL